MNESKIFYVSKTKKKQKSLVGLKANLGIFMGTKMHSNLLYITQFDKILAYNVQLMSMGKGKVESWKDPLALEIA